METLETVIRFIGSGGGQPEYINSPQTGDIVNIMLFVLAIFCASLAVISTLYINVFKPASLSYAAHYKGEPKKFSAFTVVFVFLAIVLFLFGFSTNSRIAKADENALADASKNIVATVDEISGQVYFETGYIKQAGESTIKLSSISTEYAEGTIVPDTCTWQIYIDDKLVYNENAGVSKTYTEDIQIDNNILSFGVMGMDPNIAKSLIDHDVLRIKFDVQSTLTKEKAKEVIDSIANDLINKLNDTTQFLPTQLFPEDKNGFISTINIQDEDAKIDIDATDEYDFEARLQIIENFQNLINQDELAANNKKAETIKMKQDAIAEENTKAENINNTLQKDLSTDHKLFKDNWDSLMSDLSTLKNDISAIDDTTSMADFNQIKTDLDAGFETLKTNITAQSSSDLAKKQEIVKSVSDSYTSTLAQFELIKVNYTTPTYEGLTDKLLKTQNDAINDISINSKNEGDAESKKDAAITDFNAQLEKARAQVAPWEFKWDGVPDEEDPIEIDVAGNSYTFQNAPDITIDPRTEKYNPGLPEYSIKDTEVNNSNEEDFWITLGQDNKPIIHTSLYLPSKIYSKTICVKYKQVLDAGVATTKEFNIAIYIKSKEPIPFWGFDQSTSTLYISPSLSDKAKNPDKSIIEGYESIDKLPWKEYLNNITHVVVQLGQEDEKLAPISMKYLFAGLPKLTKFEGVQNIDTTATTSMAYLFEGDASIKEIDIDTLNANSIDSTSAIIGMFNDCISLCRIWVNEEFDFSKLDNPVDMFSGCKSLKATQGTKYNNNITDSSYARIDNAQEYEGETPLPGYFSYKDADQMFWGISNSVLYLSPSTNDLTPNEDELPLYTSNIPWGNSYNKVEFLHEDGGSFVVPRSMDAWFLGAKSLNTIEGIDNSHIDTSKLISMNSTFDSCNATVIDLSMLSTDKVTNMNSLFANTNSLVTLNLNGDFNTEAVTDMTSMFAKTKLSVLDLSNFNTTKVENMSSMFYEFSGSIIDMNSFSNQNLYNIDMMFYRCASLKKIIADPNKWLINKTYEKHENTFTECTTTLEGWGTDNSKTVWDPSKTDGSMAHVQTAARPGYFSNKNAKFDAYYGLSEDKTTLYLCASKTTEANTVSEQILSGFTSPNQTPWASALNSIENVIVQQGENGKRITPFSTSNLFADLENCTSITGLENIDTTNVVYMTNMFCADTKLSELDVSSFDTSSCIDMSEMFNSCFAIPMLDLSGFDTSKVTNFTKMFYSCRTLKTIYADDIFVCRYDASGNMFGWCYELTGGEGTKWSQDFPSDKSYARIDRASVGFPGYFTRKAYHLYYGLKDEDNNKTLYISNVQTDNSDTQNDEALSSSNKEGTDCGWNASREEITSVIVEGDVLPTSTCAWFLNLKNCTSFNLRHLRTTRLANMELMFSDCSSIENIDLSNFSTERVTKLDRLFQRCSKLSSIDLYMLDTSNVTSMINLFYGCTELKSVDLYNFDTSKTTSMAGMFQNCKKLTNIDLSRFNTSKVTSLMDMFFGCSELVSIDLSNFDTSNVTVMSDMFYNCQKLTSITFPYFNTSKVTTMLRMFGNCRSLTSLNLCGFNTEKVYNFNQMFCLCSNLEKIYVSEDFKIGSSATSNEMFDSAAKLVGENGTTYDSSKIDAEYAWIDGRDGKKGYFSSDPCLYYGLEDTRDGKALHLSKTITSKTPIANKEAWTSTSANDCGWNNERNNIVSVALENSIAPLSTSYWFAGLTKCDSIDLSLLNTSSTINMANMFSGCLKLEYLDLCSFKTSIVENTDEMFANCPKLFKICVADSFVTTSIESSKNMFQGDKSLVGCNGTSYDADHVDDEYARIDGKDNKPGYFTDRHLYYGLVTSGQNLTLYLSGTKTSNATIQNDKALYSDAVKQGADCGWNDHRNFITSVVLEDALYPCSTAFWFNNLSNCNVIDITYLNTYQTTDMANMFSSCIRLKTIYAGDEFSTSNVPYGVDMFTGDVSLIGGIGTPYNEDHIDKEYAWLDRDYNLPGYFSDKFEKYHLYYGIMDSENGKTLFLSRKPTANSTIQNDGALESIWAQDCAWNDERLNITDVVIESALFPKSTAYWFYSFTQCKSIDPGAIFTDEVVTANNMFDMCTSLTELDVSSFNTTKTTMMGSMFRGCSNLKNIDVSGLSTNSAISISNMFYECSSLSSIDVSSFDTSKVEHFEYMFEGCTNLQTIYSFDGFSTASISSSNDMFKGCNQLKGGNGTLYDDSCVDVKYAIIDGDYNMPGYFTLNSQNHLYYDLVKADDGITLYMSRTPKRITSIQNDEALTSDSPESCGWNNVRNNINRVVIETVVMPQSTSYWFIGLKNCESFNIASLNTKNVTNMSSMFEECSNAGEIDVSKFNTSNVTNMTRMFRACSKIGSLNLTKFNTSQVTSMQHMFDSCGQLRNIDLSGFDTSNVTDMSYMLYYTRIENLDLCNFNTSNVRDFSYAFAMNRYLEKVDLSSFDTSKAISMLCMFEGCDVYLTALDLKSFDTSNTENFAYMFNGCTKLETIYTSEKFVTTKSSEYRSRAMFQNDPNLKGDKGTVYDASHTGGDYAHIDGGTDNPGYFSITSHLYYGRYGVNLYISGIKTRNSSWQCDDALNTDPTKEGSDVPWISEKEYIENITIETEVIPTSTVYWFANCQKVTTINANKLDTSQTTNMQNMFSNSPKLTTIIASEKFVTGGVTSETSANMFLNDNNLKGCNGTSYTAYRVDKEYACIDGFHEQRGYFSDNISGNHLYYGLVEENGGTTLYLSRTPSNQAKILNDEAINSASPTSCGWNYARNKITDVYVENKVQPLSTAYWFYYCENVYEFKIDLLDTSSTNNMTSMFENCTTTPGINFNFFNTSEVRYFTSMFRNCVNVSEMYLTQFNTWKAVDMTNMFLSCTSLTTIYVNDNFNTEGVLYSKDMFKDDTLLKGWYGTEYDENHVDKEYACIDWDYGKPGYFSDLTEMDHLYYGFDGDYVLHISRKYSFITFNQNDQALNSSSPEDCGWNSERANITGVVFDNIVKPSSTSFWFYALIKCDSYDFTCLDSSMIGSMKGMFDSCVNLKTLDLTKFDTSYVNDMSQMFSGCKNLSNVNLSSFDTTFVYDMSSMFRDCSRLTVLNLSSFNTYACENFQEMFSNCETLSRLDIPNFSIYSATNLSKMFNNCYAIKSIDSSTWNCNNNVNASYMFYGCYKIQSLNLSSFVDLKLTDTSYMFGHCYELVNISIPYIDTSSATSTARMFEGCTELKQIDLQSMNTNNVTNMSYMFSNCENLTTIYVGLDFNTDRVSQSDRMFYNCFKLEGGHGTKYSSDHTNKLYARIDGQDELPGYFTAVPHLFYDVRNHDGITTLYLSPYKTDTATTQDDQTLIADNEEMCGWDRQRMYISEIVVEDTIDTFSTAFWFKGMDKCSSIDVSNIHTNNTTNMEAMFNGCSSLTELELSHLNTTKVTNMKNMFSDCTSLSKITVSQEGFITSKVTESSDMFTGDESLEGSRGTKYSADHTDKEYARIDGLNNLPGYFWEAKHLYYGFDDRYGKLVLHLSGNITTYAKYLNDDALNPLTQESCAWDDKRADITSVVIDDTLTPDSTAYWFHDCVNCEAIDVQKLDTSNTTTMFHMFYSCQSLLALDISSFETSKVTSMSGLFYNCSELNSINVDNFNTSSVSDFSSMFSKCSKVTRLNLSTFNTSCANSMAFMFSECKLLESANVKSFNTSKVGQMACMFSDCPKLSELDVSGFDTSLVYGMWGMFKNCESLPAINTSGFKTENVTDMDCMFYNCSKLSSLDVSGFNTANVKDMSQMFYNCKSLASLVLSGWEASNVTSMANMFTNCEKLTRLNLSKFNPILCKDFMEMFKNCKELTSIDLTNFNTPKAENMFEIFRECNNIINLDLSSFDTTLIKDMQYMFYNCAALKTLNLSSFNTVNVEEMKYMFAECRSLSNVSLSSNFKTPQVTDMQYMFYYCSSLTTLDVSSFDTTNVENMERMFALCSSLKELDLSNWNTSSLANTKYMFHATFDLKTIYATDSFSVSKLDGETSYLMFWGSGAIGGNGTRVGDAEYELNYTYAHIDGDYGIDGYFTEKDTDHLWYGIKDGTEGDKVLYLSRKKTENATIQNDDAFDSTSAESCGWNNERHNITYVEFENIIKPRSTKFWFFDFDNCKEIHNARYHIGYVYMLQPQQLTNMDSMFENCKNISVINLEYFTAYNLESMTRAFSGCENVTSLDLSFFSTSNVKTMQSMFDSCTKLSNLNISDLDTSSVMNMKRMFYGCKALEVLEITRFNTANVEDMEEMFASCELLTTIYASDNFNTDRVVQSDNMFFGDTNLIGGNKTKYNPNIVDKQYAWIDGNENLPGYFSDKTSWDSLHYGIEDSESGKTLYLSRNKTDKATIQNNEALYSKKETEGADCGWHSERQNITSVVVQNSIQPVSMTYWFYNLNNCTSFDIKGINTFRTTNMYCLFRKCSNIKEIDLTSFNTSSVTEIEGIFRECTSLERVNLSNLDLSKIEFFSVFFADCTSLTDINLDGVDTTNAKQMGNMFENCSSLQTIDISSLDFDNVYFTWKMFKDCSKLKTIYVGEDTDFSHIKERDGDHMFEGDINLKGGKGTEYSDNNIGVRYAVVDNPPDSPGYFTLLPKLNYSLSSGNQEGDVHSKENYEHLFYGLEPTGNGEDKILYISGRPTSLSTIQNNDALISNSVNNGSDCGWDSERSNIVKVVVENEVKPNSTSYWFYNLSKCTSIDIKALNTSNVTNMNYMFSNCVSLAAIYASSNFIVDQTTSSSCMFEACNLLIGGAFTPFSPDHVDKIYARIDNPPYSPGYFSARK